ETDVLDTWFSSALWPFATQGWPSKGKVKVQNLPWTNVLITAREIINLWVSRMVYSSLNLTNQLPFTDILIHPVIQTPDGKRMSKSKGNAINPVELIDLYGADATRLWYASVGVFAHQDTRFPGKKEKDSEGNIKWTSQAIENKKRFINKLWNATKFALLKIEGISNAKSFWEDKKNINEVISLLSEKEKHNTANIWITSKWNSVLAESIQHLQHYRFAEYSKLLEDFVWYDFCDWYLEIAKIQLNNSSDSETATTVFYILEQVLRALNPIIPFASEELWQGLTQKNDCLALMPYPKDGKLNSENLTLQNTSNAKINNLQNVVSGLRSIRQKILGLSPNTVLKTASLPENAEKFLGLSTDIFVAIAKVDCSAASSES
ncbi:MAG TPA: class I tRNA ligase family protein, partial [Vampirovibrionales bacterium]